MRSNFSSTARAVFWACAAAMGFSATAGAQRGGLLPAVAGRHAPTCAARLHEYKSPADVGAPFDTLQMTFERVQLSPGEFRPFMLARMAEIGATGFLVQETVSDPEHTFIQFVPVFVPTDSVRIRSACDADRRPPPESHTGFSRL